MLSSTEYESWDILSPRDFAQTSGLRGAAQHKNQMDSCTESEESGYTNYQAGEPER